MVTFRKAPVVGFFFFFLRFIYFYEHWCFACLNVCVRVLDPLELELDQLSDAMWMLRIESGFSGRAASALNPFPSSQLPSAVNP